VVFAKNKQSYAVLSEAFRDSRVHKVYWAVTENQPEDEGGTVQHRIHHNYKSNVSRIVKSEKSDIGSLVKMSYQVIGKSDRYHLLEVKPHSGKTHQIRIQLSAMSCPVRGDLKYGARRSTQNGFIMLHARAISFEFPENKKITVHAEPPHDEPLWKAFNPAASSFSFS
jgi:23S rRNA pseudouridine1911/1915/1917 synthase